LYSHANSDMQTKYGYPFMSQPSTVYNTACKQIASYFSCLSITMEMPFKDCYSHPNPIYGWTPYRSKLLGASVLEPIYHIRPYLQQNASLLLSSSSSPS
jgi:murein tripeptide amidase MpaA